MNQGETIAVTETHRSTPGRSRVGQLMATAVAMVALTAVTMILAPAALGAGKWAITATHGATSMPPGGEGTYIVEVFNVGDVNINVGTFTLTAELPDSVEPTGYRGTNWTCNLAAEPVSCTHPASVNRGPRAAGTSTSFRGKGNQLKLTVDVHPLAADSEDATFTVTGGGAINTATAIDTTAFSAEPAGFGFETGLFRADLLSSATPNGLAHAGLAERQASSHPFEQHIDFTMNLAGRTTLVGQHYATPDEHIKTLETRLPAGLLGNPEATPKCPISQLGRQALHTRPACPRDSQVGVIDFTTFNGADTNENLDYPVFNLEPPPGSVAAFGTAVLGNPVIITASVDPADDYAVVARVENMNESLVPGAARLSLWGVPADPAHNMLRHDPAAGPNTALGHPYTGPIEPFLTLPSDCDSSGAIRMRADSWRSPGQFTPWEIGADIQPTGCDDPRFDFEPSITVRPEQRTPSTPTAVDVELTVPQTEDTVADAADLYAGSGSDAAIATPPLRGARVVLPEGMTVSPSSADGLEGCTTAQIALGTDLEPACPDASKIGSVSVETPLLAEPLTGDVYVASQGDNPFSSLLAIYIVAKADGVMIKLPGRVDPDPVTGRLTTTFDDNPQLPFSKLNLRFMGGSRAPLVTPATCGTKTTSARFTSWNAELPAVDTTDSFTVSADGNGAPCPARGFAPGFTAGTVDPVAGGSSPLVARITRGDGDQELSRVNMTLPGGLLADLSDVDVCSGGALAAATGKSGRLTQGAPACPAGSQVGTVTVGAGPGSDPFFPRLPGADVSGRVFLTDAHSGGRFALPGARQADYGLAFEVPAVAGPFDLGTVLVRAAIYVDPSTARLTVLSDPLPRILDGIPLQVRDVRVRIDRGRFTVNPTSCRESRIVGDIRSVGDMAALRPVRFQVGSCARLGLEPRLAMRLVGKRQVRSEGHPALRARLTQPAGDSNIRRVRVQLPRDVVLDSANANDDGLLCSYEDGLASRCPASSVIGRAVAVSPLLKRPLRGPVHFVQGKRRDKTTGNLIRTLPTLLVKLDGEVQLDLRARTNVSRGRLVTVFPVVPDAPVSSFRLALRGGKERGILTVTEGPDGKISLCDRVQHARVGFRGHSGRASVGLTRVATPCADKRGQRRLKLRGR